MSQSFRDLGAFIIALILVATFCSIVIVDTIQSKPLNIPGELLVLVSAAVAFFFGAHANANGAYGAQQTAAATAAQIVTQTVAAGAGPKIP
jgi:hypothetical protein